MPITSLPAAPMTPAQPSVSSAFPPAAPMMGHGMAALSSQSSSPDTAVAPSLSPVTPIVPPAPMTPTQQMPEYHATALPTMKKRAPLVAGAVIAVVMMAGVGAGLVLSGQDQDVRNQAYVAPRTPAPQQAYQTAQDKTAAVSDSNIVVEPSMENVFGLLMSQNPSAQSVELTGNGISGKLYRADDANVGSKAFFAKVQGLQKSEASVPMAWIEMNDGTMLNVGQVEINESGVGHFVHDDFSGKTPVSFFISYENPELLIEGQSLTEPTEKVANASF